MCNLTYKTGIHVIQFTEIPLHYLRIYDQASRNQPTYIELKEIVPNVNAAMGWLEKVDKIGAVEENEDPYKNPPLGAPRNQHEAELLEGLMKKHTDYSIENGIRHDKRKSKNNRDTWRIS